MKMSQKERLLWMFQMNGGRLTLGQLLADESGVGYKCTTRFSELRQAGYPIQFIRGETASQNTWVLNYFDEKGQGSLL
jgi:hypothetical protein